MRRALLAITGLAASTTALVVLKGSPGTGQAAQALSGDQPPAVPGGLDPAAPGGPSAVAPAPSATGVKPSAKPSASGSRSAGTKPTATKTTAAPKTTTAAPKPATRTLYGPTVSYRYGSLRVQITVSGTKIVNATATGLPTNGESGQKSDAVQSAYSGTSGQVVQKQSANLNTVSDATYTSNAYKQSLQSAISQI